MTEGNWTALSAIIIAVLGSLLAKMIHGTTSKVVVGIIAVTLVIVVVFAIPPITNSSSGQTNRTISTVTVTQTVLGNSQTGQNTTAVTLPNSSGTPAWAWVTIGLGTILVLCVIVLIVRTRRV